MLGASDTHHGERPLSVAIISLLAVGYVSLLAALTVLTQSAQLLRISFLTYATLCAIMGALALAVVVVLAYRRWRDSQPRDYSNLAAIVLIGLLGAFLSTSMHRVGRISPDEYYGAVNPVYYTQHPEARMGFESRLFYSRSEVGSAAFFTAGPYEYIQSAFAFLFHARFATVYYLVGAGITGFLIPAAIFLAVYCLSGDAWGSTLGALMTVAVITTMGETSWAPGANSFLRAFEGKAFLQFVAVPLFTALSFRYFAKPSLSAWLALLALCVATAGSSTTSFALIPLLGIILCGSYFIAFRQNTAFGGRFILRTALYFASFVYIGLWALFVALYDGVQNAAPLNADYPSTFNGYLAPFIYPAFPLTPVLLVLGIVLAVFLARNRTRVLLLWWVALAVLLALNPLSAQILLKFFRGIYFRLLYLLPFPLCWGLIASFVFSRTRALKARPATISP